MRYQENKGYQPSMVDGPKWRFKGELISDENVFPSSFMVLVCMLRTVPTN